MNVNSDEAQNDDDDSGSLFWLSIFLVPLTLFRRFKS
ncbi:GlyGly-CTERM sorting domain-containing protein [Shewanella sp. TB7-MNA-CIBAN-0143]